MLKSVNIFQVSMHLFTIDAEKRFTYLYLYIKIKSFLNYHLKESILFTTEVY
jgi:hypothetical protein